MNFIKNIFFASMLILTITATSNNCIACDGCGYENCNCTNGRSNEE